MRYQTQKNIQHLIDLLIQSYPDGVKTGELASALSVSSETVRSYLARLDEMGIKVNDVESGGYTLDPQDYTPPLHLTLAQAWFLYLLLRRIVRADLGRYPLVNTLLHRLSENLHGELAAHLATPSTAPTQWDDMLNILVDGWQKQRQIRITYRAPNAAAPRTHIIAPYWFEPAVWSDSNYLIAGLQQRDGTYDTVPFKLDRILSAYMLSERFERPPSAVMLKRLEETWGIWDNDEPVNIVLRFNNRVIDRLNETRWHPTQRMTMDAEGYVIWRARIAEPQEMMPWIRGWGADVEVLEPESVRAALIEEVGRMATMYKIADKPPRQFF